MRCIRQASAFTAAATQIIAILAGICIAMALPVLAQSPAVNRTRGIARKKQRPVRLFAAQTPAVTLTPIITTTAGNGTGGYSGDGGPDTSATLNNPTGIAMDPSGNTYIADTSNNVIRKVNAATGIITTVAGGGSGCSGQMDSLGDGCPATSAVLEGPAMVELDAAGNMYILDAQSLNNVIRLVYFGGLPAGFNFDAGLTAGDIYTIPGLGFTSGIGVDGAGDLFVAGANSNTIYELPSSSPVPFGNTVAGNGTAGYGGDGGPATSAMLNDPIGSAVDPANANNLYIADNLNHRIRVVYYGGSVPGLSGLSAGNIYTVAGNGTAGYGGDGGQATQAELNGPVGIEVDGAGNLYIVDAGNARIRGVSAATGFINTLAGTGTAGYGGDGGPATSAQISNPQGLAVLGANGSLYIADTNNQRVRVVSGAATPVIFPATPVASSAPLQNVLLSINASLTISGISVPLSQGGRQEFSVGTVSGCTVDGVTTNLPGSICTVPVTFSPAYPGLRQGPLVVQTSQGAFQFAMNGVGQAPQVTLSQSAINTVVGNGIQGYSGDGGPATLAELYLDEFNSHMGGAALDSAGNLYFTDAGNYVVRKVNAATGIITTVAGDGVYNSGAGGINGDGGPATSAQLGQPFGVALDGADNLYIADYQQDAIRMVSAATGIITTVAGNGYVGYQGDGGPATGAELGTPAGVAVDAEGNLYIADYSNQVVRKVTAATGTITTVAGNGNCGSNYCGDGGPATSAALNWTAAVAVDLAGNLYIADTDNYVIREVNAATGIITTVAGTGTQGSSGDGGPATAAQLGVPEGVAVDAAGDIYISDQTNQGVRVVSAATGTINPEAGVDDGVSGYGGDGGVATLATLSNPSGLGLDSVGNLEFLDTDNNRVRTVSPAGFPVTFSSTNVGLTSFSQLVSVTNIGNEPLTFSNFAVSTNFTVNPFCSTASPLAPGDSCAVFVALSPTVAGDLAGTLTITDNALNNSVSTQIVQLSGTGAPGATSTTLISSQNPSGFGQSVTFTATIAVGATTMPSGTVAFTSNGTSISGCSAVVVSSSQAACTTTGLSIGADSIIAIYSGDSNYTGSDSIALSQVVSQVGSSTALASSANPSSGGMAVTLTATVNPSGPPTPTGTVAFASNGTAITGCMAVAVTAARTAACTTATLTIGTDSIVATYSGDTNYLASSSATFSQVVGNASPSTTVASNLNPSVFGQSVTLTATVSGGASPTGTVGFVSNGSTITGCSAVTLAGNYTAQCATSTLSAGTDAIVANYSGDSNNSASSSNPLLQVVNTAITTTGLTSSLNPSFGGQTVTFTATVTASNGKVPTGTVTFDNGAAAIGTIGLNGSGIAVLNYSSLVVGTHSISAAYNGSTTLPGSTSSAVSQVVNVVPTTTALTSSPNPSTYGQAVALTATVTSATGANPTGEVSFYNGATLLGNVALSAGVAVLNDSNLPAGTDTLSAKYIGSSYMAGSTSPAVSQMVNAVSTTTTLTTAPNPSASGQTVVFTAIVTPANGSTAAGTVTFFNGSSSIGTATLNSSGAGMLSYSGLPVGTDRITGVYGGSASLAGSTSAAVSQVVNPGGTMTTLTSSPNPSLGGQAVTFMATVTAQNGKVPTGTVTFYNGASSMGSASLSGSGVAVLGYSSLVAGTHSISATYNGSTTQPVSTSSAVSQVVNAVSTSTGLTSSPNPSTHGQTVALQATVTSATGTAPTGTVSFYNGTTLLGNVSLSAGIAALNYSNLPAGTDTLTAKYSGSNYMAESTSTAISQVVNTVATATSLSTSPNPSISGQSVAFTASVTSANDSTPVGSVTFFHGSSSIGTGTLNSAGVSVLNYSGLPVGANSVTAAFGGSAGLAGSTSAAVSQVVNPATTSTTLTSSLNPSFGSQAVTFTAAVTASNGKVATGTVTFLNGTVSIGSATLSGSGGATLVYSDLVAGTHSITATYNGSTTLPASTSPPVSQVVNIVSTTTALTSSPNPSLHGQAVVLTATVTSATGSTPSGTVSFYNGATLLGNVTLSSGVAVLNYSNLPAGTDSLTAKYPGSNYMAGSTSPAVSQTVTIMSTTTTVGVSPSSTAYGGLVDFQVAVASDTPPTGTVTIKVGSTTVATCTISGGSGDCPLTPADVFVPVGTDTVTATYNGDVTHSASSGTASLTVTKDTTTTTFTTSPNPSTVGQSVTLTATVSSESGAVPTGTVTFIWPGSATLGTATLNSAGVAVLNYAFTHAIPYNLVATYNGSATMLSSEGVTVQDVGP